LNGTAGFPIVYGVPACTDRALAGNRSRSVQQRLGRNILPLERDGLIAVAHVRHDRRSKELRVTEAGEASFRAAMKGWREAQRKFEAAFGAERTAGMRALLHAVAATDLGPTAV
jgi:DNA-binding MarR family transcriptional regulator